MFTIIWKNVLKFQENIQTGKMYHKETLKTINMESKHVTINEKHDKGI